MATSSQTNGSRLLWRGAFAHTTNIYHGIAIVAHLFNVPSPAMLNSAKSSPFSRSAAIIDDPFSPFASGIDICLGIEMLRSANLKVLGDVYVTHSATSSTTSPVIPTTTNGNKKGKIRSELNEIIVETPTDVRVYIDQRCPETVNWFEKSFCTSERQGIGIRLEVGGEEVVIFAAVPAIASIKDDSAKPQVTLLLGRAAQLRVRKPRPDDPLPRESLFANKLRRTTSLPALDFDHSINSKFGFPLPSTSKTKLVGKSKKLKASKTLTGLLNGEKTSTSGATAVTKKPKEKEIQSNPDPFAFDSNIMAPTTGTRPRAKSLARGAGTPGRRGEKRLRHSSSLNQFQRSPKIAKTDQVDDDADFMIPGSPTPSVATTHGGFEEMDEDVDMLTELPSFSRQSAGGSSHGDSHGSVNFSRAGSVTSNGDVPNQSEKRAIIQRSSSLPVGLFGVINNHASKSASLASNGVDELEVKNKATLRKLVLSALTNHGVNRSDNEFKDIFSITLKGVQFALRSTLQHTLLDRTLATMLITRHAEMYIAPASPPPPPITIDSQSRFPSVVKREFDKERSLLEGNS